MNIKQKIISCMIVMIGIFAFIPTQTTYAACTESSKNQCCGGVKTSIIHCDQKAGAKTAQDSAVWGLLLLLLNILTAGVGIAAVGGIVYGSLLYASASDKAEQAKKGIGIITNVVIGIIMYGAMYLVLNFLIPGGIFK